MEIFTRSVYAMTMPRKQRVTTVKRFGHLSIMRKDVESHPARKYKYNLTSAASGNHLIRRAGQGVHTRLPNFTNYMWAGTGSCLERLQTLQFPDSCGATIDKTLGVSFLILLIERLWGGAYPRPPAKVSDYRIYQ